MGSLLCFAVYGTWELQQEDRKWGTATSFAVLQQTAQGACPSENKSKNTGVVVLILRFKNMWIIRDLVALFLPGAPAGCWHGQPTASFPSYPCSRVSIRPWLFHWQQLLLSTLQDIFLSQTVKADSWNEILWITEIWSQVPSLPSTSLWPKCSDFCSQIGTPLPIHVMGNQWVQISRSGVEKSPDQQVLGEKYSPPMHLASLFP